MPEQPVPSEPPRPHATASVYHASGLKVYVPLLAEFDYAELAATVDRMLASGWRVSPPGTEPGEDVEEIGSLVWREADSRSRASGVCPRVDMYSTNEALKWSTMSVYLNTEEEQAEFEKLAGVKLENLQPYVGQGKLERGHKQTDKLIHKCRPFKIVIKDNPNYDEKKAEAAKQAGAAPYIVPKRQFVRFLDAAPSPAGGNPPASKPQAASPYENPDKVYENLIAFLSMGPAIDVFNAYLKDNGILRLAGPHRDRCGVAVKEYAGDRNWTWALEQKEYVAPPPDRSGLSSEIPF